MWIPTGSRIDGLLIARTRIDSLNDSKLPAHRPNSLTGHLPVADRVGYFALDGKDSVLRQQAAVLLNMAPCYSDPFYIASDAVDTFVFDVPSTCGIPLYLESWLHRQPIPSTMTAVEGDRYYRVGHKDRASYAILPARNLPIVTGGVRVETRPMAVTVRLAAAQINKRLFHIRSSNFQDLR